MQRKLVVFRKAIGQTPRLEHQLSRPGWRQTRTHQVAEKQGVPRGIAQHTALRHRCHHPIRKRLAVQPDFAVPEILDEEQVLESYLQPHQLPCIMAHGLHKHPPLPYQFLREVGGDQREHALQLRLRDVQPESRMPQEGFIPLHRAGVPGKLGQPNEHHHPLAQRELRIHLGTRPQQLDRALRQHLRLPRRQILRLSGIRCRRSLTFSRRSRIELRELLVVLSQVMFAQLQGQPPPQVSTRGLPAQHGITTASACSK